MATRHYYAAQRPRGFANETYVYKFASRAERDAWVAEHEHDGGVNSYYCGAYSITARHARQLVGYRGDDATESYNVAIDMTVDYE